MSTLTISKLKYFIETLTELKKTMNGKCGDACPLIIIRSDNAKRSSVKTGWTCSDCIKYTGFIKNQKKNTIIIAPCPCHKKFNQDELFLIMDELIEDFTLQLSKRWED